jgi:hypothetical protein
MWWSESAVPRWIERSLLAAMITVVGFVGAVIAYVPVAATVAIHLPDWLLAWLFWHPASLYAIALACGLALAFALDRLAHRS